jgi:hypothetical protein
MSDGRTIPEIRMVCSSPPITMVRIPLMERFPLGRTESIRALIFAWTDPWVAVAPSPLKLLPVLTPRPTSGSDDEPTFPEDDSERSLAREVVVFASFEALDVSTTRMVTASPRAAAFWSEKSEREAFSRMPCPKAAQAAARINPAIA